ncbi:N-formyl peptide receptor 2-like [Aplysia californica]|uniref:N-formyl peptide receptor 2-like n=1 Tax=Aplysia californica TaxID=6500 RepID=A0ABM0JDR6_APLCA|nr:N-formyl peptide receptor 2-like [Aplysia californica]
MSEGNLTTTTSAALEDLISFEARQIFVIVSLVVVGDALCLLGIVANIINITVFAKQGFHDTVNISLCALAVGDLGALITQQWFNICVNPWFQDSDIPFNPLEIQSLTGGFSHRYFTKTTGWITAFVTFERCLCVSAPLKVKAIITRRVAVVFNVSIFFLMALTMLPVYLTSYYDWTFYPALNKSLVGIHYTMDRQAVLGVSLFITDFFVPLTSFAIVILCTVIIVVQLKRKGKWRQMASGAAMTSSKQNISSKDKRVVAMVTVISAIFIVSFTPITVVLAARAIEPELNIIGRYANTNWTLASLGLLIETFNSTINILVYYRMSTKFKDTFKQRFPCCFRESVAHGSQQIHSVNLNNL